MSDDDGLHDELADALVAEWISRGGMVASPEGHCAAMADALLPVVARRVEQARADERDAVAAELDRVPNEVYPMDVFGGPWSEETAKQANRLLRDAGLPVYDRVGAQAMRYAYRAAARMIRESGDTQ